MTIGNTTGDTSGEGTTCPSGAPEIISVVFGCRDLLDKVIFANKQRRHELSSTNEFPYWSKTPVVGSGEYVFWRHLIKTDVLTVT